MAKKTHSSSHSSSQNPHAHKTTPDPTLTPPLPSKPSSLSSQSQPLHIQPLSTSPPHRPNRSKKPTPVAVAAAAAAAAESSKKSQRVCFTPDDVLLILRSLSDFKSKSGKDPLKHLADFHNSLKSALSIKTTGTKLREKIRALRIKFDKLRENSEENIKFSCPWEEEVFQLSKKFWGQENELEQQQQEKSPEKENAAEKLMLEEPPKEGNAAKKPSSSKKPVPEEPPNKAKKSSTMKKKPIQEELSSVVDNDKMGHLSLSEMFRFGEMRMDVNVLKRGMELIGESEKEELGKRWKKLKVQEAELFLKRAELAVDQGRLILKELKRSS